MGCLKFDYIKRLITVTSDYFKRILTLIGLTDNNKRRAIPRRSAPDLVATVFTVVADDDLDVKGVWQNKEDCKEINDDDEEKTGLDLKPLSVRVADNDEPVERNDGHRQRGDVDGDALRDRKERAQDSPEEPFPGEGLDGREGDGEAAHEDVGESEVGDEDVGRVLHRTVLQDDVRDEEVSDSTEHKDEAV